MTFYDKVLSSKYYPVYEMTCSAMIVSGKSNRVCNNKASFKQVETGKYFCGIHYMKAGIVKPCKYTSTKPRSEYKDETSVKDLSTLQAMKDNVRARRNGSVYMMETYPNIELRRVTGRLTAVCSKFLLNTTGNLSPFIATGIELYTDENDDANRFSLCTNLQNYMIYSTCYREELNDYGVPGEQFFRNMFFGYRDSRPHSTKINYRGESFDRKPMYGYYRFDDKGQLRRFDLVEERWFRCRAYLQVMKHSLEHYRNLVMDGYNLEIRGETYISSSLLSQDKDFHDIAAMFTKMYDDPLTNFDHNHVILMFLTTPSYLWPWNRKKPEGDLIDMKRLDPIHTDTIREMITEYNKQYTQQRYADSIR